MKIIKFIRFIIPAVTLSLYSCSMAITCIDESVLPPSTPTDSILIFREQARLGDGHAYLQLARRYHDGNGVEHDFLTMWNMLEMAIQYGAIDSSATFLMSYPAEDPDRLLAEAMTDIGTARCDLAMEVAERLDLLNHPYAFLIRGAIAQKENNDEESLSHLRIAADNGIVIAEMLIAVAERGRDALWTFADRVPILYCFMARNYADSYNVVTGDGCTDEQAGLAAYYYRKAYENLCLDDVGVRWLYNYYVHLETTGSTAADGTMKENLRLLTTRIAH